MTKLDNADYCEFAHDITCKIGEGLNILMDVDIDDGQESGYTDEGQVIFDIIHDEIEQFVEDNTSEDIAMLERENKAMAEYLENVCGLSQEEINEIANF